MSPFLNGPLHTDVPLFIKECGWVGKGTSRAPGYVQTMQVGPWELTANPVSTLELMLVQFNAQQSSSHHSKIFFCRKMNLV